MGNSIKYTTGTESNSLVKGNFRIGTGDVGKGPSSTTGFYKATAPPSGGYRIYLNNESVSGNIAYHTAANDSELISFTNQIADESFTEVSQCFEYYTLQNDKICINNEISGIPTDSISSHYDLSQVTCRPINFDTEIKDIGTWGDNNSATLENGPIFTTNSGGGIVLDGGDDYLELNTSPVTVSSQGMTYFMWVDNYVLEDSRNIFINFNSDTLTALRHAQSSFISGGQAMEFFFNNPSQNYGPYAFSRTIDGFPSYMLPNVNFPLFLCLSFVNRGEGNFGCYLIMNDGDSGLIGGICRNLSTDYVLPADTVFGTHRLGAVPFQQVYLNGTINMFSAYNKSFFPITTDIPGNDTIPKEVQQYYDTTKGRFGL